MSNSDDGSAGVLPRVLASWGRRLAIAASVTLIVAGFVVDRYFLFPGFALLLIVLFSIWWHSPIQSLGDSSQQLVATEGSGPATNGPNGQLEVHRRRGTAMLGKPFEFLIDGEAIQNLKRSETESVPLVAGWHVVQARLGTYASQPCRVEIKPKL